MKLKKFNKKLNFNKTTVSRLDNINLKNAKGGAVTIPFGVCLGTVNATICFTDCGGQACLAN